MEPLTCLDARPLISADADDELGSAERALLGAHLEHCADCGRYADQVAGLARTVRVRRIDTDPEFVARVVERAARARLGRGAWLRPALAWCGVMVAAESVRPFIWGQLAGSSTHVARHVGASALALAVAFLAAAWRPDRAAGMLPFVGALLCSTVVATVLDTVFGTRSAGAEYVHVAEVVGMVLLWVIAGSPGWDRVRRAAPHRARRLGT